MNNVFIANIIQLFLIVIFICPANGDAGNSKNTPSSPITIRLSKATSLMNAGKANEAFELLWPLEDELAGNSDYDYLFGIAALESGHPAKASLALERVLAMKPGFAGARVDLGRAYFAIGNYRIARKEFTLVLQQPNPPPLVKAVINKYMVMIEERLTKKKNQLSGWVEISGGYDSNVNYATADTVIKAPGLQSATIPLSDDNIEQDDAFLKCSINMGLLHHFTPTVRSFVGVNGSKRFLANEQKFETEDAQLRTYLEFGENINTFRIGAVAGLSTLDQTLNSKQVGGNMVWQHALNPSNLITLFSQYDTFRYPDVQVNNFDQWVGGVSWIHAMPFMRASMLAASAYGGYAFETENRADGDNSIYGLRLGYHIKPFPAISIIAGVGEQLSDFKKENAIFQEERDDQQLDVRLAVNWTPIKRVSIGGMISHVHNNSNIPIYEYRRNDVSARIQYYFF
ncbi:MAG: DUF560 domain-containing protein [Proteobacteria bacterium]|nr:DUF560 domain-containing protein [Pseudomonadota bacterium]